MVTVPDDPAETPLVSPASPRRPPTTAWPSSRPREAHTPRSWQRTLSELRPDFVFSFYYRALLGAPLLQAARRGALNMHGSLLPKYRGRAPVNWAILRGERETGATLHYMVERADAGDIVDSQAVPILVDDDAREVYAKVTVAAEMVLARSLPALLAGTAPRRPQPLAARRVLRAPHARGWPHRLVAERARRSTTWCAPWRRRFPARSGRWAASAGRSIARA